MSNLEIKDIETLERLSLEDMEQVVGGDRCNRNGNGKALGRVKRLDKFGCDGTDATVLSAAIETIMEAVAEDDKVTLVGF